MTKECEVFFIASDMTSLFNKQPEIFLREIYGSPLGRIRMDSLLADLERCLLQTPSIQRLLDIGSGHAPVTLQLLARHPRLSAHLVDPSEKLLHEANNLRVSLGISQDRVVISTGTLETVFQNQSSFPCDLLLSHAVANWVPDPLDFIRTLTKLCVPSHTVVSLVFGSSIGKAFRFVSQGMLDDAMHAALAPGTPVSSLLGNEKARPLDPDSVLGVLAEQGCTILDRAGVRIFADYAPSFFLNDPPQLDRLQELETAVRRDPQYWKLGQLAHIVFCR
jgi:S-adenosylmethionine-dependent methyltransferase